MRPGLNAGEADSTTRVSPLLTRFNAARRARREQPPPARRYFDAHCRRRFNAARCERRGSTAQVVAEVKADLP